MDIVLSTIDVLIVLDYSMVIKHLETNFINKVDNIIIIYFIDSMVTINYSNLMDNITIKEDIHYKDFNFIEWW